MASVCILANGGRDDFHIVSASQGNPGLACDLEINFRVARGEMDEVRGAFGRVLEFIAAHPDLLKEVNPDVH